MVEEFSSEKFISQLEKILSSHDRIKRVRSRKNQIFSETKAIHQVTDGKNPSVKRIRTNLSQALEDAETALNTAGESLFSYLGTHPLPEITVAQYTTAQGRDEGKADYAVTVSVQDYALDQDSQRQAMALLDALSFFSQADLESDTFSKELARQLIPPSSAHIPASEIYGRPSTLVIDALSPDQYQIFVNAGAGEGRSGLTREINRIQAAGAIYNMAALSENLRKHGINLTVNYEYVPFSGRK